MIIPVNDSISSSGRQLSQSDCFKVAPLSAKIVPNIKHEISTLYKNVSLNVNEYELRETKIKLTFPSPQTVSIS